MPIHGTLIGPIPCPPLHSLCPSVPSQITNPRVPTIWLTGSASCTLRCAQCIAVCCHVPRQGSTAQVPSALPNSPSHLFLLSSLRCERAHTLRGSGWSVHYACNNKQKG